MWATWNNRGAQPKIFFGTEEDKSPTDSNRPGTPCQNNRITELAVAWTSQKVLGKAVQFLFNDLNKENIKLINDELSKVNINYLLYKESL